VKLSDLIYQVLTESREDLMPLEVQDLVRNHCSYRSYLKAIGEEQNQRADSPEAILLHDAANNFRKIFIRWLQGAYKSEYRLPEETWAEGLVLVRHEGRINGVPVFLETVPARQFQSGAVPERVQHVIAARSFLLNSDTAYVVMLDQNTQGWQAWTMTGDFSQVGALIQQDAAYVKQTLQGDSVEIGLSKYCSTCPYEDVCDVEKVTESGHFPRVRYSLTLDGGMVGALEKYLWSLNNNKNRRKTKVIHPSEITTSKCDRKIAYGLLGIEEQKTIEPKLRRIFDMGHAFHDLIQMALKYKMEDAVELEAACAHDHLKIFGRCDLSLPDAAGEIKTISYKGFDKLRKQSTAHEDQNTIYATALDKGWLIFLYVNKDTGEIKEFRTKVSRARWHKLATRASRIVRAVSEDTLPEKINKAYICNPCKYRWYCKPEVTGNARRKF